MVLTARPETSSHAQPDHRNDILPVVVCRGVNGLAYGKQCGGTREPGEPNHAGNPGGDRLVLLDGTA